MAYAISEKLNTKQLILFALPTICMLVFMSFYTIVDGIFVARYVSSDALASLNITFPLLAFLIAVSMMFGSGGSAFVAHRMGMKRQITANRSFTLIVLSVFLFSVAFSGVSLFFIEEICIWLGASEKLLPYAVDYLFVLMLFAPFCTMQWVFQCFLVTASKPNIGFVLTLFGGCLNIIFDYLFIVTFNMGIAGAAYATAISWVVPCIGALGYFIFNKNGLTFKKPHFHFIILGKSMYNGSSEMIGQLAQALITILFNLLMMKYLGENGVAAITAALYCEYLMISAIFGFSIGIAPIISYHYGAKNINYLKKTIKKSFLMVFIASCTLYLVCVFGSPYIVGIFFKEGTEVYNIAKSGLVIFSLSFLFMGTNIFASALFTALGNGLVSGILAFSRTFLFLVTNILIFSYFWEADGIWYAVPVSEFMAILVFLYYTKLLRTQYELL